MLQHSADAHAIAGQKYPERTVESLKHCHQLQTESSSPSEIVQVKAAHGLHKLLTS